jgi:hypothetical protein
MPTFFRQAAESQFNGSPAYLDSIMQLYQKDHTSGLIQVKAAPNQETVILFENGTRVRAYCLEAQTCTPLSAEQIIAGWQEREASIRTMALSETALWVVWLALEFHPPVSREKREGRQLAEYLAAYRATKSNLLLHLTSEESDGFVPLWEGEPLRSDACFSTVNGFASILPFGRLMEENSTAPWEITTYPLTPQATAYPRLLLRSATSAWIRETFRQYQELVGMRMIASLAHNINLNTQSQQWNIRLENNGLVDHHIFLKAETCILAYLAVLRSTAKQIENMIGSLLAQRILTNTFAELSENQRQVLQDSDLTPARILE